MFKRLLAVVCLTAAPLAALIGYHHVEEYRRLQANTRAEAIDRTQTIAAEYDRLLTGAQYLLVSVARRGSIRTLDPATCRAALIDIVAELQSYAALAAYDLSGRPLCASFAHQPNENVANRPFFRRALASGSFALGNALRNRSSGRLQLPAALPFSGTDGQIAGVVMLLIDLEWITRVIDALGGAAGTSVVVADRDGTVILQSPPPRELPGRPIFPPLPPVLNEVLGAVKAGTVAGPGSDEVRRIWGYSPLGVTPKDLFVAAGINEAAAIDSIYNTVTHSLVISLSLLLLALASGLGGGWLLLHPGRRHPAGTVDLALPSSAAPVQRLRRTAHDDAPADKRSGAA